MPVPVEYADDWNEEDDDDNTAGNNPAGTNPAGNSPACNNPAGTNPASDNPDSIIINKVEASTTRKLIPKRKRWGEKENLVLRQIFLPYIQGEPVCVKELDILKAKKMCSDLAERSNAQIRTHLNNLRLGKSH